MPTPVRIGYDTLTDRDLFVLEAAHSSDVEVQAVFPSRYFACLLAWDSTQIKEDEITKLVDKLLDAGCAYICCWGPGCEQVHDFFEETECQRQPNRPVILSTWHNKELLADVLWFILNFAYPVEEYSNDCWSTLGIALGEPSWAEEVRQAFSDPRGFSARHLGEDETNP